jgi:hypothetical protein
MRCYAIYSVNAACLLAAIVFICLPGCSRRREKWVADKYQFSLSIAEAKERGTFECEVEIIPSTWNYAGKEITFEAAWLERMPDGYFAGPFALCFLIDQGKEVFGEPSSPLLVIGDGGDGVRMWWRKGALQVVEHLYSSDLSLVRASVIKTREEKRSKDIRFVAKS